MHLSITELIRISRPRFRLYTAGPFLVGVAAAGRFTGHLQGRQYFLQDGDFKGVGAMVLFLLLFFVYLLYFLFPANLLIYGVNDIADEDTDILNAKKQGYELLHTKEKTTALKHAIIKRAVIPHIIGLLLVLLLGVNETLFMGKYALAAEPRYHEIVMLLVMMAISLGIQPFLARLLFYASSIFYSLPPIRAKAKPFIDGLFNVLYILPGLIGFLRFGGSRTMINRETFVAALLRCMAMHAYSAIPDIEPDAAAGLKTTAVVLGKQGTLLYCRLLRGIAAVLSLPLLGSLGIFAFGVYTLLIILSLMGPVFQFYKWFPLINGLIGFMIFLLVAGRAAVMMTETM